MYHVRTLASLSYYRYVFGLNYGIFTVFRPILAVRNIVLRGIYGCACTCVELPVLWWC